MSNSMYKKEEFKMLVDMSKNGDIKALEEIIKRIQKDVYVLFSYLTHQRQDISDLTQDALLKIAKNIKNLKNAENFKSWLNQIVTNTFYDYIRQNKQDKNVENNENKLLNLKEKAGCEPGEKCLYSELDKIVKAALLDLPEKLRIVIILREYEGLSYDDISKITNTTLGTVKSRISRLVSFTFLRVIPPFAAIFL